MLQLNAQRPPMQEQDAPHEGLAKAQQQQQQQQQQQRQRHQLASPAPLLAPAPPSYLSIPGGADASSSAPPPLYANPAGSATPANAFCQPASLRPTDPKLRGVLLDPTRSQRVSKRILSFMEAEEIVALGDAALFYNRLVQWMFDENSNDVLPPALVSEHGVWTAESQANQILGDLPMPPSTDLRVPAPTIDDTRLQRGRSTTAGVLTAPPPRSSPSLSGGIGATLMSPFTRSSNSNTRAKAKKAKADKAESMVRSLTRKELKEVARLGARCKQLEAKVMVLQNENSDLSSMVEAAGTVKEFLLAKIKDLEDKTQLLQGQTDNDKEIIGFLDGSVQRQEQELGAVVSQRNALQSEHGAMRKELSELKTQKKVLVSEVKRLRKAIKSMAASGN